MLRSRVRGQWQPRRRSGALRRRTPVVLTVAVLGLVLTGPAAVAEPAPNPCPTDDGQYVPTADVEAGMTGFGLTVTEGTEPRRFGVRVRGVIQGSPMPIILVETDLPDSLGQPGIWSGISGSPVYLDDGRWLGALGWGFSTAPSPLGGVTPAEDMLKVLAYPGQPRTQPVTPDRVTLSRSLRQELVAGGDVTTGQAQQGLRQLPVPVLVSGIEGARLAQLQRKLGSAARLVAVAGGTRARAWADDPEDARGLVPGGNFAAAVAYGEVTSGAVGTTTIVCDGVALAFGHPFSFQGATALSAHEADALAIQDDATFGPFKMANIGNVVGTLDQDRSAAIRARLGQAPATVPVVATVHDSGTDNAHEGTTQVNGSAYAALYGTTHALGVFDRVLDRVGSGRSRVTTTIIGTKADGEPFSLVRRNRFAFNADPSGDFSDVALESVFELGSTLDRLYKNELEHVRFTRVELAAEVAPEFAQYRFGKLQRQDAAGTWAEVGDVLRVTAGEVLHLRTPLLPFQGVGAPVTPELDVAIPATQPGGSVGTLDLNGGQGLFGDPDPRKAPTTFDGLLASLANAPRNNELVADLRFDGETGIGPISRSRTAVGQVVAGNRTLTVMVEAV